MLVFVLRLVSIYVSVIDIQLWLKRKRHQKWFYFYIVVVILVKLPIYGCDVVVETFKCDWNCSGRAIFSFSTKHIG